MTQELVSSCLIVTTYKKQVDKLKLVEAASLFWFKNEHHFSIKEWIFPQKYGHILSPLNLEKKTNSKKMLSYMKIMMAKHKL